MICLPKGGPPSCGPQPKRTAIQKHTRKLHACLAVRFQSQMVDTLQQFPGEHPVSLLLVEAEIVSLSVEIDKRGASSISDGFVTS